VDDILTDHNGLRTTMEKVANALGDPYRSLKFAIKNENYIAYRELN
jgi:hypothetical protein